MQLYIYYIIILNISIINAFKNIYHNKHYNILYDIQLINEETINQIVKGLGFVILTTPNFMKDGEKCNIDDDCPNIMRCCQIANRKYCCNPNNYINLEPAYIKQYIEPDIENNEK